MRLSILAASTLTAIAALELIHDATGSSVSAASSAKPQSSSQNARAIATPLNLIAAITPPESLPSPQQTLKPNPANDSQSPQSVQFTDLQNYWAKEAIETLAQQGIVKGFADGTFRPNDLISPEHFEFLLRAAFQEQGTDFLKAYVRNVLQSQELSSDERSVLIPAMASLVRKEPLPGSTQPQAVVSEIPQTVQIRKQLGDAVLATVVHQLGSDRANTSSLNDALNSSHPMTRAEAVVLIYRILNPTSTVAQPESAQPKVTQPQPNQLALIEAMRSSQAVPTSVASPQAASSDTPYIDVGYTPPAPANSAAGNVASSPAPSAASAQAQLRLSQILNSPQAPRLPATPVNLPSLPEVSVPSSPSQAVPASTSEAVAPAIPQLPPPPASTSNTAQLTPIPSSENPAALLDYWQQLCQANGQNHTDILSACDQVLAINPSDAQIWATRGKALFQLGRYSEAVASYDRSLAIAPTMSLVWVDRCSALSALGNQEEAIASCSKALELDQNWDNASRAVAWYHWGVALKRSGRNEDANTTFDRALAIDPAYSLAWADKCRALSELGKQEDAIAACDRALQVDGNWGDRTPAIAWQNRALALTRLERYEDAIDAYNQALAINPNDATSWTTQGVLLAKLGRYSEALTSQDWAVKVSPNYSVALVNRCVALNKLGQFEAALAECEKALNADGQWNPEGPAQAWDQQGHALAGLGRLDDALAAANRAVGIKSDYAEAWANRGVILWRMDKYEDALASTESALQINPNYSQGWFNKGRILKSLERYEQAIAAYDQALRVGDNLGDRPTLADIWANRTAVLWQLRRYDDAFNSANQAIRIAPSDAQAWYNRGVVLVSLRRYNDALLSYEQAIRYDATNAYAWAGKGVALENLGRQPEARDAFEEALKIDPNQPIAQQRRAL